MLIGVLSDTHDYIRGARLAARLFTEHRVELVIHLGDIVAPFTLRALREAGVKNLIAIYGNNDGERLLLQRVASAIGFEIHEWPYILEVGGRRLALVHGYGSPEETRRVVEALLPGVDAVLYGHTHQATVEKHGERLVLNPGEACGCFTGRVTAALLDLSSMEARVVELGIREDRL